MARSKLIILSAIFAYVSSSPLLAQEIHQGDEIVLSNPAGPTITAISSPATAAEIPPSHPRPARVEPGRGSHRLHNPHPSQTAPIAIQIQPRLDIQPAPTPIEDTAVESSAGQACTTTLSEKVISPCFWDGTRTIYPYTTTRYKSVDCHGCGQINVIKDWYHCPNMRINDTQEVSTPSTHWTTICEPSTALALVKRDTSATPTADEALITTRPGPVEIQARPRRGQYRNPRVDNAPCPTTFVIQPEKSAGKTSTRYSRFTTTTIFLNCGGCPLFLSTALAGYGPANGFTKTTTLPVGTTTTYACYY